MSKEHARIRYQDLTEEYQRQLRMVLPADMHYLVVIGHEPVEHAIRMIQEVQAEVEKRFAADRLGFRAWKGEEEAKARGNCGVYHGSHINGEKSGTAIAPNLFWDGHTPVPLNWASPYEEPDGILPSPERWRHHLRWIAADYFITHRLAGPNLPAVTSEVYPGPLTVLDADLRAPDTILEALRIANDLTDLTAKGRDVYRSRRYEEGKPNIPRALAEEVGKRLGVSATTARARLIQGGFRLPDDLAWVVKPAPPGKKSVGSD